MGCGIWGTGPGDRSPRMYRPGSTSSRRRPESFLWATSIIHSQYTQRQSLLKTRTHHDKPQTTPSKSITSAPQAPHRHSTTQTPKHQFMKRTSFISILTIYLWAGCGQVQEEGKKVAADTALTEHRTFRMETATKQPGEDLSHPLILGRKLPGKQAARATTQRIAPSRGPVGPPASWGWPGNTHSLDERASRCVSWLYWT